MTRAPQIVFLFNLVQDVNILRPLAFLARRETGARLRFLLTQGLSRRDPQGLWRAEIAALAAELQAETDTFADPGQAFALLQGGHGLILAASESSLSTHAETHQVFRLAPPGFLRITLQHGFECVGLLQNREHVLAHGRDITFGADVVCAWMAAPRLTALQHSQRGKLMVTGPSTLLQQPRRGAGHPPIPGGMICENLHSVRLIRTGNHRGAFMDVFAEVCLRLAARGQGTVLRPHPGGQYVLRNKVPLPPGVVLNNLPMWRVDLAAHGWGISAPSTILIDMVLAGLPVGVWTGTGTGMDIGNYAGLATLGDAQSWLDFIRDAGQEGPRAAILAAQGQFLDRQMILTDRAEITRRFARLLANGAAFLPAGTAITTPAAVAPAPAPPVRRLLCIANGLLPTLQISFLKPLSTLFAAGTMDWSLLGEAEITKHYRDGADPATARAWLAQRIAQADPDLILCCRYSGPGAADIAAIARARGIALIQHLDDDLLHVPPEIGAAKHRTHSAPERTAALSALIRAADVTSVSTPHLQRRLRAMGFAGPMFAGAINCGSDILAAPRAGPLRRLGYMGFGHEHDFEVMRPALESWLIAHPQVEFELFGTIPLSPGLAALGPRVRLLPQVRDYPAFLRALAARHWDLGLAPLADTAFNAAKSINKWVEYTACGTVTLATRGTIYDACIGRDRGLLLDQGDWTAALDLMAADPELRVTLARAAQAHLLRHYSQAAHCRQVLELFGAAVQTARGRAGAPEPAMGADRGALPVAAGTTG